MRQNKHGKYAVPSTPCLSLMEIDDLPKSIREILQRAHCNYYPTRMVRNLVELMGEKHVAKIMQAQLEELLAKDAKLAYGPDHPQAQ